MPRTMTRGIHVGSSFRTDARAAVPAGQEYARLGGLEVDELTPMAKGVGMFTGEVIGSASHAF